MDAQARVDVRGLAVVRSRVALRVATAIAAALATVVIAALNEHDPYDIQAGTVARTIAGLVPLIAAALAACTVLRPKLGLLAMLLLIPVLDVAQIRWDIGPLQVIDQTLFVVALGVGLVLRDPDQRSGRVSAWDRGGAGLSRRAIGRRLSLPTVALAAVVAMLAFATLSTALSPDVPASTTVLLHGILEPFFIAAALLMLRPTRGDLIRVMAVLAVSVAIGGLLNMIQTIPAMKTLSEMQVDRLLFSRITYFNVGLFGEMLALTLPLLLALLLAQRKGYVRLPRTALVLLVAALPVDIASLFLTFSKSAYLASAGGCLVLLLLFVHTWRRRAAISLAVVMVSAVVIPWPALVLQAAPPLDRAYRSAVVSIVGQSRFDSWNPSTASGNGSLVERWYATQAGIEMALRHPFLGISLDQFRTEYVDYYRPAQAKLSVDWAHSMLPEVAAELGFPALALDLIVYAAAMLAAWRVYRAPPDPLARLLACALLATMVAWQLVGTAFAGDMYRPWRNMASDYVVMMVLIAASFALYRLSRGGMGRRPAAAEA
jgi:hypothetical protein